MTIENLVVWLLQAGLFLLALRRWETMRPGYRFAALAVIAAYVYAL